MGNFWFSQHYSKIVIILKYTSVRSKGFVQYRKPEGSGMIEMTKTSELQEGTLGFP